MEIEIEEACKMPCRKKIKEFLYDEKDDVLMESPIEELMVGQHAMSGKGSNAVDNIVLNS